MGHASINSWRLTADRERALVCAAADGDEDAQVRLIQTFTPLIASAARTYARSPGVDRAELMQEGVAGLLEALRRYDSDLGTPFWAYASWWVRQAMQRCVAQASRPIVLGDRANRQLARLRDARRRLNRAGRQEPSIDELAASSALTPSSIERLLAVERTPRALEEALDSEDGLGATLGELLADPAGEDGYERVVERVECRQLRELTEDLGPRERDVVYAHFGVDRPTRTLREIAETLNVSPERVRQIEERALTKLRDALSMARAPGNAA